jgi:membrane dipeptidase
LWSIDNQIIVADLTGFGVQDA